MTSTPDTPQPGKLLDLAAVMAMTSLSKGSVYKLARLGRFPKARPLIPGGRRVAWPEAEVRAWVAAPLDWGDPINF